MVARIFWAIALLAGIGGGIELYMTYMNAESAPQQAAGAALSLAIACIPYVFARAIEKLTATPQEKH